MNNHKGVVFPVLLTILSSFLTAWFFCCIILYAQNPFDSMMSVGFFRDQLRSDLGIKMVFFAFFILFSVTYYPFLSGKQALHQSAIVLGLLYGVMFIVGVCQQYSGNEVFHIPHTGTFFRLGMLAAFSAFFGCGAEILNQKLDKKASSSDAIRSETLSWRSLLAVTGILLVLWLPYFVLNYPGSVCYDAVWQYGEFFGVYPRSNNNPFFDTAFYGVLFRIGAFLGNSDNSGVAFTIALQLLLLSAAFAYSIETICYVTNSRTLRGLLIFTYAVIPMFGGAAQIILKDSLHLVFVMFYFSQLVRIIYLPFSKGLLWRFFFAFILAALSRKAALSYVLVGGLTLVALIRKRPEAKKLLLCIALCVLCTQCVEKILYPMFGVAKAPNSELMALPIQSVSYMTRQNVDDIHEEILLRIDAVLGVDQIMDHYDPNTADPMKQCFRGDNRGVMYLCFALAKHYPVDFAKSIVTSCWKYFSPLSVGYGDFRAYISDFSEVGKNVAYVISERYLQKYADYWRGSPLLSLFIGPGLYSWMLLFAAMRAWRNKSKEILVLIVPMAILMFGLIFTPINGECRYAYPLIGMAPIILAWACCSGQKRSGKTA